MADEHAPSPRSADATAADREAARALLRHELDAVARHEPDVHAWVARHPPRVLEAALAEAPPGPLHGFTLGVKDIIDTADLPTRLGSPIFAARRPALDAACVALARRSGAVVVGKTVTTELAMLAPGPTRNPHHLGHTPGGSSSGSAAGVAAGMVRVAFGTQTAGSMIRPASFCGVLGFKATHGLVPLAGVHLFSPSLDTLGWYARSVDDLVAVLDALAPGERTPRPTPAGGPLQEPGAAGRRLRVGLYRTHEWDQADASSQAAVTGAAERLAGAGVTVEEVALVPAFEPLVRAQHRIMVAEGAVALAATRAAAEDRLSANLRSLLEAGDRISRTAYVEAQLDAERGRRAFRDLMAGYDALLVPAAVGEAPAGLGSTGDSLFNRVWTLLGGPCLGLPATVGPAGLPIGVQLVSGPWSDRALLRVGARVHEILGPCPRPTFAVGDAPAG